VSARTVLCYGDSNTHGTEPMNMLEDRGRFGPDVRWPGVLAAALGPGWRVVEEGLPGRTTVHPDPISGVHKNGLAGLPIALESHAPVDVVVILLGTNDLKARFQVPPVEIAESVHRLVLGVRQSFVGPESSAPQVLLVVPPPVIEAGCLAEIFAGGADKSRRLAAEYRRIADRHAVGYLDAAAHIASSPVDGVHFDAAAHEALGQAVAQALREMAG